MPRTSARLGILAIVCLSAASSQGALVITEAMSSSGNGGTADWFELTNTGPSAVDATGYKMDDSSFAFANAVLLSGVGSIPAGTSALFVETDAPLTDLPTFRTFWGGSALTTLVGSYPSAGLGVGLSSSGDGVVVFDTAGTEITARASFGAATAGSSFIRSDGATAGTFGSVSQLGVAGAFQSVGAPTNIASPGVVAPEPASLAALVMAGLVARRRRA
jgi:hypothetical protein